MNLDGVRQKQPTLLVLVVDVIYTAWMLANNTQLNAKIPVRTLPSASHELSDAEWVQKVRAAAQQDQINDAGLL